MPSFRRKLIFILAWTLFWTLMILVAVQDFQRNEHSPAIWKPILWEGSSELVATLLVLVQLDRVNAIIAFIIIGREITISALREWMAEIGARKSVAVSSLGKVKTAAQMAAIPMLLFHDPLFGLDLHYWGQLFLWIAGVLTVWSMFYYLRRAWPLIKEKSGNM